MADFGPAFGLSLRVACMATVLALLVALPLAALTGRRRFAGRSFLDALLLLPLVLPPTVVGYLLLVVLGRNGIAGEWLARLDVSVMFNVSGAVLAAAVVAFPLLYLPAKSGMADVSQEMLDTARIYGASRVQLFWHVLLPMARRNIAAGAVLAFARALGEFGATIMVLGWRPGRTTLPIEIYSAYIDGRLRDAWMPVGILVVLSLGIVMLYHRLLGDE